MLRNKNLFSCMLVATFCSFVKIQLKPVTAKLIHIIEHDFIVLFI